VTPVQAFYSPTEPKNSPANRVYHNNNACRLGLDIPRTERRPGTNEGHQCDECAWVTANPQTLMRTSMSRVAPPA
jgi:hypothetical protein